MKRWCGTTKIQTRIGRKAIPLGWLHRATVLACKKIIAKIAFREERQMTVIARIIIALAAFVSASGALAQTSGAYPNRPIRLIVGFTAGGPTDVIARIVAQKLSETWGQQIYVE